ncbi:MAG: hypothetical protein RIR52_1285, partial [Acidobacteriota bacterium]
HYLKYGLCVILVFVGAKMLLADFYKIPVVVALGTIIGVLLLAILASVVWPVKTADGNDQVSPD